MREKKEISLAEAVGQNRMIILCLFLVGLTLRVVWLVYARTAPASDFLEHYTLAEGILDHFAYGYPDPNYWRVPAYPFFLALLMLVSRNTVWLGLWNVLLSSIIVVYLYLIAWRLSGGNRLLSAASGLVGVLTITLLFLPPVLASEFLFGFLVLTALVVFLYRLGRPMVRFSLMGVLMGLAVLTRGEGLFYIPAFLFLMIVVEKRERRSVLTTLVFLLCLTAVIIPWYARNRYVAGPGVGLSSYAGVNFYFGHNDSFYGYHPVEKTPLEGLDKREAGIVGYRLGMDYIRRDPVDALIKSVVNGTKDFFEWSAYPIHLSKPSTRPTPMTGTYRTEGFTLLFRWINRFFLLFLTAAAVSPLFYRVLPWRSLVVPWSFVFMNWFGYVIVFIGHPRYRFFTEIMGCILCGITVYGVVKTLRYVKAVCMRER